jgi:hypothetical protein
VRSAVITVVPLLDAYDFFFETYSKSSREKLLEFMAQSLDIERLRTLSHRELPEEYAAGMATAIWGTLGQLKNWSNASARGPHRPLRDGHPALTTVRPVSHRRRPLF